VAQLDVVDMGQTLRFNALHGMVDGRGDRFDLIAAAGTPWADVEGQFGIHKDAPFKLQGRFNAIRNTPVPVQAALGLTGELADWYGIDAGHLRQGDRADFVVIDPAGLDESVDGLFEANVPEYGGISRMVNRSDDAAVATVINGRLVYRDGEFAPGFGIEKTGQFLRAGEKAPVTRAAKTSVAL